MSNLLSSVCLGWVIYCPPHFHPTGPRQSLRHPVSDGEVEQNAACLHRFAFILVCIVLYTSETEATEAIIVRTQSVHNTGADVGPAVAFALMTTVIIYVAMRKNMFMLNIFLLLATYCNIAVSPVFDVYNPKDSRRNVLSIP